MILPIYTFGQPVLRKIAEAAKRAAIADNEYALPGEETVFFHLLCEERSARPSAFCGEAARRFPERVGFCNRDDLQGVLLS